ncbi:MAG: hypothetical protein ACHRHE_17160 [Tepidisphaerales bacterium]
MQHRFGHTSAARRAPVTPLRAGAGALAGVAVALVLYFSIGRGNDEVPPWITLPPGAVVKVSAAAPEDETRGAVRYYLRYELPGDPATVLVQFTGGIAQATWDPGVPRLATHDDLGLRSNWPAWVREQMYRVPDVSAGRAMSGRTTTEWLHAYAWPTQAACVVELVQEVQANRGTTQHSAKPDEY